MTAAFLGAERSGDDAWTARALQLRYGSRRVHVQLQREGWIINHKKTRRFYNELGMQLRNKTPKRRVRAKLREDRGVAVAANETWAMDFVQPPS